MTPIFCYVFLPTRNSEIKPVHAQAAPATPWETPPPHQPTPKTTAMSNFYTRTWTHEYIHTYKQVRR